MASLAGAGDGCVARYLFLFPRLRIPSSPSKQPPATSSPRSLTTSFSFARHAPSLQSNVFEPAYSPTSSSFTVAPLTAAFLYPGRLRRTRTCTPTAPPPSTPNTSDAPPVHSLKHQTQLEMHFRDIIRNSDAIRCGGMRSLTAVSMSLWRGAASASVFLPTPTRHPARQLLLIKARPHAKCFWQPISASCSKLLGQQNPPCTFPVCLPNSMMANSGLG